MRRHSGLLPVIAFTIVMLAIIIQSLYVATTAGAHR